MGIRSMTVRRFEEIRRRLSEGRGLREIARALGCSRDTVREVRDGLTGIAGGAQSAARSAVDAAARLAGDHPRSGARPSAEVLVGGAGPAPDDVLELLEAVLPQVPAVPRRRPSPRASSTPGERVEVDYAGDPIEWFDIKTGEIHKA